MLRTSLLAFVPLVAGCGSEAEKPVNPDTHDARAAESVATLAAYLDVLEQVTDEQSARALLPRIVEFRKQLADIEQRKEALGDMTPAQQEQLIEKYGPRIEELGPRQGAVGKRIMNDPVLREILADKRDGVSKRD